MTRGAEGFPSRWLPGELLLQKMPACLPPSPRLFPILNPSLRGREKKNLTVLWRGPDPCYWSCVGHKIGKRRRDRTVSLAAFRSWGEGGNRKARARSCNDALPCGVFWAIVGNIIGLPSEVNREWSVTASGSWLFSSRRRDREGIWGWRGGEETRRMCNLLVPRFACLMGTGLVTSLPSQRTFLYCLRCSAYWLMETDLAETLASVVTCCGRGRHPGFQCGASWFAC